MKIPDAQDQKQACHPSAHTIRLSHFDLISLLSD
jgi:hypothetical protein